MSLRKMFGHAIAKYSEVTKREPSVNAFYQFDNNLFTKNAALIFTGRFAYIIDISKSYNGFGPGELIRINAFSNNKTRDSTQYDDFKQTFDLIGLEPSNCLIKRINSKRSVEYSTDLQLVDEFLAGFECDDNAMFWLPHHISKWVDKRIYTYKNDFQYSFVIDDVNHTLKATIFVNRGFVMTDVNLRSNGQFSYNVRGIKKHSMRSMRTEYTTLCRVDGAHGFYHIHFGGSKNGTAIFPSYDVSNIEIRVSQSKTKHIERKIRRLDERKAGMKIINVK